MVMLLLTQGGPFPPLTSPRTAPAQIDRARKISDPNLRHPLPAIGGEPGRSPGYGDRPNSGSLFGDLHIVDAGLDEAAGGGVGGLDEDPDALPGELGERGGGGLPGSADISGGAEPFERRGGARADDSYPQEVGRAGVVEVCEIP